MFSRVASSERKSLNQECGWKDGDRGGLARMQGIHGRERENRKSKQKKRKTHLTHTGIFIGFMNKLWRRGWDSNPRYGFPYARFRGEYFQPLSHLSAVVTDLIVAERDKVQQ